MNGSNPGPGPRCWLLKAGGAAAGPFRVHRLRELVADNCGFATAVLWFTYFRYAGRNADDARP